MDIKIGLLAPYEQLVRKANKLSKKKGINLWAEYAAIEEAINAARVMKESGIDVIIAREGTDAILKDQIDIPIVPIKVCSIDLLRSILEAKKISDKIVLASFRGILSDSDLIRKVVDCRIREFKFFSRKEAYLKMAKYNNKEETIVGGGLSCAVATDLGFRSVLIESSEQWINYALDNAYNVAHWTLDEKQKRIAISTIVNQTAEGIVAVDINKNITVFNSVAEEIFQIPGKKVIGTCNDIVLEKTKLLKVLTDNREIECVDRIDNRNIIIHSVPLEIGKNNFGGVCTIHEASQVEKMEESIRFSLHERGLTAKHYTFHDILGQSDALMDAVSKARKFSDTDFTILITGETGTGKELFAHSIVNESKRKRGPFIAINCAAIPPNLLEAELFGYEEGSFTGALKGGKLGYFEAVHKGTIFLDEIGELTFELQGRLLRVIEQKEVIKVGGNKVIPVDVRVISATNKSLPEKVAQGNFREDLYHRLNVLHLYIPPLRERIEDLVPIAQHILNQFKMTEYEKKIVLLVLKELTDYPWTGNVRELSNILTQLFVMMQGERPISYHSILAMLKNMMLDKNHTMLRSVSTVRKDKENQTGQSEGRERKMEGEILREMLKDGDMNMSHIAKTMGMSRTTLWRRLKKYGLSK